MRYEHPIRLAAPGARVDRGGALYLSREPVEGFSCERRGEFYALTPGEGLIAAFAAWAGPLVADDGFARSLLSLDGGDADRLELLIEGIKLLDLGGPDASLAAYEKRVRRCAAVCLREKAGGGLLWLCAACAAIVRKGLTKQ